MTEFKRFSTGTIEALADDLARTATTEPFLDGAFAVSQADPHQRLDTARAVADVKAMAARGVQIPTTLRMSPRTFEELSSDGEDGPAVEPLVSFSNGRGTVVVGGTFLTVEEARPVGSPQSLDADGSLATAGDHDGDTNPSLIAHAIRSALKEIGDFVASPPFQAMLAELYANTPERRPAFVSEVVLNEEERLKRGITIPAGMQALRSAFEDARPTLFAISKMVPLAYPWHRVTVTFDSA